MNLKYNVDIDTLNKIQAYNYKKHPAWKEKRWVRLLLLLIAILLGVYAYKVSGNGKDISLFGRIILIGFMPYLIYFNIIKATYGDTITYNIPDSISMDNSTIKYKYYTFDLKSNPRKMYEICEIQYEDITKIEYDNYYERVDIYGAANLKSYNKDSIIINEKNITKEGSKLRIYLCFEHNNEILDNLGKRSGVIIQKN